MTSIDKFAILQDDKHWQVMYKRERVIEQLHLSTSLLLSTWWFENYWVIVTLHLSATCHLVIYPGIDYLPVVFALLFVYYFVSCSWILRSYDLLSDINCLLSCRRLVQPKISISAISCNLIFLQSHAILWFLQSHAILWFLQFAVQCFSNNFHFLL
jgi:hypothetical protein